MNLTIETLTLFLYSMAVKPYLTNFAVPAFVLTI